ncbi:hypothetical protein GCM10010274_60370 [Streptomyces lavendofoliae]|uniref:Uncharacterized protein n=1 Tax=Streptomyces lavendofoliae TaxID=67314 RepID=A0A918M770_9ACTN|nr:hypothetical protein GCM10010274_60370 [Streptomyces lavendofoliae]
MLSGAVQAAAPPRRCSKGASDAEALPLPHSPSVALVASEALLYQAALESVARNRERKARPGRDGCKEGGGCDM